MLKQKRKLGTLHSEPLPNRTTLISRIKTLVSKHPGSLQLLHDSKLSPAFAGIMPSNLVPYYPMSSLLTSRDIFPCEDIKCARKHPDYPLDKHDEVVERFMRLLAFEQGRTEWDVMLKYTPREYRVNFAASGTGEKELERMVDGSLMKIQSRHLKGFVLETVRPIAYHLMCMPGSEFASMDPQQFRNREMRLEMWERLIRANMPILRWYLSTNVGTELNIDFIFHPDPPVMGSSDAKYPGYLGSLKSDLLKYLVQRLTWQIDDFFAVLVDHNVEGPVPEHFDPRNEPSKEQWVQIALRFRKMFESVVLAPISVPLDEWPIFEDLLDKPVYKWPVAFREMDAKQTHR